MAPNAQELLASLEGVFEQKYKNMRVERKGKQIILPEGMSLEEGVFHLIRLRENEEKEVAVLHRIECHPLDGVVALSRVIQRVYGFSVAEGTPSWGGENPPLLLSIPTGTQTFEQVIWGRIAPPPLEGGFFQTGVDTTPSKPAFLLRGKVKRKFDAQIHEIAQMVEQEIRDNSIYRGKAIQLNLDYMNGDDFDPIAHAPKFMSIPEQAEENLLLTARLELELETSVYMRIEQPNFCKNHNIPLKHGVLLAGPYGTGKSLTAQAIASKAERNGYTFIYLTDPKDLVKAMPTIKLLAPVVVFVEDIEKIMGDGTDIRTPEVNELLNTLDGIDSKGIPFITVFTTNHPERIHPGFRRAGRIDTRIILTPPDAEVTEKFIRKYLTDDVKRSLLDPKADLSSVCKMAAENGMVPAFIREACNKAVLFAHAKIGKDNVTGKVTVEHLMPAFESTLNQVAFMRGDEKEVDPRSLAAQLEDHLVARITESVREAVED